MKRLIAAASIGQFREVVGEINRTANFVGLDENGKAMYDPSIKKPVLTFIGTVKLHGTFAAACYNEAGGLWAQSKNDIITPANDNAGWAFFVEAKKEVFIRIIKSLAQMHNIDLTQNNIMLCAEWAGLGIQKTVAISKLEKTAFIFKQAKVSPFDKEKTSYWIDTNGIDSIEDKIYNIANFKTFSIEVDFNVPQLSQNKIIEMTVEVENECPVAKELGEVGIGEGIVFTHLRPDGSRLIFKSKGEKHSAKSKVKTLKPVDDEKINKMIEVAEKVTPSWRLEQMMTETFDLINGGNVDRAKLGDYIRAVINDVVKEDLDVIFEAGFELKDIAKYVSSISRDYFFEYEKENLV
ncbi:MAG: RNA ligase family protein [Nanoarchaeota archaeon]